MWNAASFEVWHSIVNPSSYIVGGKSESHLGKVVATNRGQTQWRFATRSVMSNGQYKMCVTGEACIPT